MKLYFFIILLFLASVTAADLPELRDFVTDQANILSPEEEAALSQLAKEIEQETSVEVAIVTIESLEDLTIEQYAVELFEEAGIGKEDVDNGLLILIVPSERKYRIEVGFGLEGVLPDIRAREIGVNVLVPYFRNEQYGEGLFEVLKVVKGHVSEDETVISEYNAKYSQSRGGSSIRLWIYLFFFILFIISSFGRKRRGGFFFVPLLLPGGGGFSGGSGGFGSSGFGGFSGGGMSGGGGFSGGW